METIRRLRNEGVDDFRPRFSDVGLGAGAGELLGAIRHGALEHSQHIGKIFNNTDDLSTEKSRRAQDRWGKSELQLDPKDGIET